MRDERGVVLLLALGFIAFIGVIAVVLGKYAVTNLRSTIGLRDVRSNQFSADSAMDGAINAVRWMSAATVPTTASSCFTTTLSQQTGAQSLRVDCSTTGTTLPATQHVSFTACLGAAACTSTNALLVATVDYDRSGTPSLSAPVKVLSWSVKK